MAEKAKNEERRERERRGAAYIEGTGITVTNVLGVLRLNRAVAKIVQKYYPGLTGRQIDDAILHALDAVRRSDAAWAAREAARERIKPRKKSAPRKKTLKKTRMSRKSARRTMTPFLGAAGLFPRFFVLP